MGYRQTAGELLARADVRLDGDRPWDLRVHDERLYQRVFRHGTLGLGEAYMDGWWECDALDRFFDRVQRAGLDHAARDNWPARWLALKARVVNLQRGRRAFEIGEHHYDIGNELYERMLDGRMNYSCGYWRRAKTLDDAQEHKLELVCRKLGLSRGMRLLDIGCGWGALLQYAAERYDVEAVGVTVSREQAALARERCKGLDVDVRLQDYRTLGGERFDRVASIGMFEHVGHKNHRAFMELAHRSLEDGGLLLLHTIGRNESRAGMDPWIARYIFPNSALPSVKQIAAAAEGLFVVEDWHNFGQDYDPTLMAWRDNVEAAWDELLARYDERFRRMWRYYLLSSAGSFRARKLQLWQVVLAKDRGVPGGYDAVR